jgi:hypothetical protein
MSATIISQSEKSFKLEIEIFYSRSLLDGEEGLQRSLNEAGSIATGQLIRQFDSDGSPIQVGDVKFYAGSDKQTKEFQTPYGPIEIARYVYQSAQGGKTYVPLDISSRMIGGSTPKFAKMVTSKYACDGAPGVQRDLAENHNRMVALSFIKNLTDMVGAIALAKEETWSYELPDMPNAVASISVGLDGTCLNMIEDGWREAMCGTIAFFDRKGERMHTVYTAAAPEYGKETFMKKFGDEVDKVKNLFPKTLVIGLADGAATNWSFLSKCSDILTVDFWHFSEYLAKAAGAMFPGKNSLEEREEWLEAACHRAKHKMGGAMRVLNDMKDFSNTHRMSATNRQILQTSITYISNNMKKMQYHKNVEANQPIGSGVTEAACKVLVKLRMCKGAARWKNEGAAVVLTLRSLHMTNLRWDQFWSKYSQYGYNQAA